MKRTEVIMLRNIIEQAMQSLTDDTALQAVTLFPEWKIGIEYDADERVKYMDVLYRCITAHKSQETWTPDISPSLWTKVLIPDVNVIPEWEQPDSTNPYAQGDKVIHNGETWMSDVDGNVWEPGVYGWTLVTQ